MTDRKWLQFSPGFPSCSYIVVRLDLVKVWPTLDCIWSQCYIWREKLQNLLESRGFVCCVVIKREVGVWLWQSREREGPLKNKACKFRISIWSFTFDGANVLTIWWHFVHRNSTGVDAVVLKVDFGQCWRLWRGNSAWSTLLMLGHSSNRSYSPPGKMLNCI